MAIDTGSLAFTKDEYLVSMQAGGLSPRTVRTYQYVLDKFVAYVGKDTALDLALTPANVESLLVTMSSEGKAGATKHLVYRTLRSFGTWCVKRGLLTSNPVLAVSAPRFSSVPRPVMEETDIESMLKTCEGRDPVDIRDGCIIRVFLTTGLRRSELGNLRLSDWDRLDHTLRVRVSKSSSGRRQVYVPASTERVLYRWLRERERFFKRTGRAALAADGEAPLFVGLRRGSGEAMSGGSIRAMLVRRAAQAGVSGRVYPHRLRHSFAHWALSNGLSDLDVATSLGHADTSLLASVYGASRKSERSISAFRSLDGRTRA